MKSVILAAGVGRRLGERSRGGPKCLLTVGGQTLLERMLRALFEVGVRRHLLVVGYAHERLIEFVGRSDVVRACQGQLSFCVNPDYQRGSILSLWSAREAFDDDLLILDADVLFPVSLLRRLVQSPHRNAVLVDTTAVSTGEEMMVMVRGDRAVGVSRSPSGVFDRVGEGVGFYKISRRDLPVLVEAIGGLIEQGGKDCDYEQAMDLFFKNAPVGWEPTDGLPWTEIDFPEDIEKAERIVLPNLDVISRAEKYPG